MLSHTRTLRRPHAAGAAAIAAACVAGAASIVIAEEEPSPQAHPAAVARQSVNSHRLDFEANKAASMRALGLHRAARRTDPISRREDLETNKARSMRARSLPVHTAD